MSPLYSTQVQPSGKVTFFNKEREMRAGSTGPILPPATALKLIGNKEIYRQIVDAPSRAPDILFGNLKHN